LTVRNAFDYVTPFKPFLPVQRMMSRVNKLALFLLLPAAASNAFASGARGVSPAAEAVFHLGPIPITNSMVTSWVIAALIVIVIKLAIKKPQLVPTRAQAMVESMVQGILDLTAPIVGNKVAKHTLPLLITLFTYILFQNWSGLLPGVGTVYYRGHALIRPGNADMNGTLALALVAFIGWFYFVLRYAGLGILIKDIFGNKADKKDIPAVIYYPLFGVFFAVGLIEVVSILFRPVSLSFRLFGNVFGGENLIHAMSGIMKWGLPVPFYFLELLIGFVQALVFTLLVSVYIGLICNHGDESHDEHAPATRKASSH
jgi:F-type H+-transporting ATPase subunit a